MDILLENMKGSFDGFKSYLNKMKSSNELDSILFDIDESSITDTTTTIVATSNKSIVGMLSFKKASLNNKNYWNIPVFLADNKDIAESLINNLIDQFDKSDMKFIKTSLIKKDSIYTEILFRRFKKYQNIYCAKKSVVIARLSKSSSIDLVRLTKNNQRTYSRQFINLLTDHDISVNRSINDSVNKPILNISLKSDRTHRIKLSYFINTIVKDTNWHAYLVFDNEDTNHDDIIGFVKGLTDYKTKLCNIDIFLNKYYQRSVEHAFHSFLKNISAEYISLSSSPADKINTSSFNRWFGKEAGSSYFYS